MVEIINQSEFNREKELVYVRDRAVTGAKWCAPCGGALGSRLGGLRWVAVDLDWADHFACSAVTRFADKKKICRQTMEFTFARGRKEEGTSADP